MKKLILFLLIGVFAVNMLSAKEEAEGIKKQLEEAGATVKLK